MTQNDLFGETSSDPIVGLEAESRNVSETLKAARAGNAAAL